MNATRTLLLSAALLGAVCAVPTQAQNLPALPQSYVNTSYPVMTGSTINVPSGGDFQGALNQAQLGDTITLQAGATYSGNFTLSPKSGSGWIIIRTSAPDSSLPAKGNRMTPSYSSSLPKIVSANSSPAIQAAPGAHHYRLVALELTVISGLSINYGVVMLGDSSITSLSQVPTNIILDRVYIHGQPNNNLRRGVGLNSATSAVIDSYISEVHESGNDNQAIMSWNGPGPVKISNNYLEAAGENVLFGGADPAIVNLVPSDIEVRGNYFFKPTSWQSSSWQVKNILELKNAQRVLVDGNIFEHNWPQAQNGYSILFTVRNQSGTAPWSVVQDVTFTHNIVRHVSSAINMQGWDDLNLSQQTYRILISNNVFEDVSDVNWGGFGNLQQVVRDPLDVTVDHNTAFPTNADLIGSGTATLRFTYRNNLEASGKWGGVAGDYHYGDPAGAISTYFPGAVFTKNALQGADCTQYPPNNYCPATMTNVGFVNYSGGDYHLSATSPYKNAGTDGKDIGADIDAVNSATAGAINGSSSPPPPPPADTTPPTVSITAPPNGATVSGTTTVTANASDNIGVVGVQFFVDGSPLGVEDLAAPYSVSWNTLTATNGSHTLSAGARDAAGNNTTSAVASVTVSNTPTVQSPYYGTPFQIPGRFEAEDFDRGGEGLAYHDLTPGNQGGFYRTSEDVDIINPYAGGYAVNNFETGEWLEYTINVPQSGTYRIEALVSSEYTTSLFHVEIDGVDKTGGLIVPNTGWWGTFQWVGKDGISLAAGQHVLRITSDMQYFNLDALRITAQADTTPPTVAITAPSSGATVSASVSVTASASDNVGVVGVQFYLDGSTLGAEVTASPFAVSWNTTATSNGAHTLSAKARDAAGNNTTSAGVTVTVANTVADTTPPTVAITAPGSGATVSGSVQVTASASDNVGVVGVQFYLDGSALGTEDAASPFAVSWNSNATSNGAHTLTAKARDAAGNNTTSAGVTVTVANTVADTTPPSVAITAPSSGATVSASVQVTANASDNVGVVGVQFYLDGSPLGAEDAASPFAVSWNSNATSNGAHTLTAKARDAAGNNTTSAGVTVTVANTVADTTPPSVSISSPATGATVSGTMTISANASDNVGVAGVQFYVDGSKFGTEDTTAPYAVSWDTTKVANSSHTLSAVARDAAGNSTSSASISVTVSNASGGESPYYGTPFQIPGRFEAEDFDRGGEGLAYHDLTPGNQGGFYRTSEDVDIISPYRGGYAVNNFETGEWLNYTIYVTQSGTYRIEALVSSEYTTSLFHVEIDGVDQTGRLNVPNTGWWGTFQWVGKDGISLAAGQHILRITSDMQYFNLDALRITAQADTTPPTVSITAPSSGATVSGSVQVTASASDDVGVAGVQFYLDGSTLGAEVTASPFAVSWNTTAASNGAHTLTATARDAAGNNTTSAGVTVTVSNTVADTTPPSVAITAPGSGATVSGSVQMTAGASDNVGVVGVQFYLDGSTLGAEVTASPFAVSWNTTTTSNGAHTLTANARDAAGNNTMSAGVTVTVANTVIDTTPPTVSITAPSSGATLSGSMQVTASASDNVGVVGVQFYLDGSALGAEVTASPFAVSWNTTTTSNGAHTLTANARDASGNSSTSAPVGAMVSNSSSSPNELPYKGTPFQVPGQFDAVDFDLGGEGVAYHDLTPGNQGGYYRLNEDVDIISLVFGYAVDDFQTGEWLNYTINVTQSGTYRIEALVSSVLTTSRFHVEIDGANMTGSIKVPNTGSWTMFQWVGMSGIVLPAGQHVLKIYSDKAYFNFDAISVLLETPTATARKRSSH
jgi:trehalose-6-phosphatase